MIDTIEWQSPFTGNSFFITFDFNMDEGGIIDLEWEEQLYSPGLNHIIKKDIGAIEVVLLGRAIKEANEDAVGRQVG